MSIAVWHGSFGTTPYEESIAGNSAGSARRPPPGAPAGRVEPARAAGSDSGPSRERGLPEFEQPEIHRVDLCGTLLALHASASPIPSDLGGTTVPPHRLAAAERLLLMLGALEGGTSTYRALGRQMLELPVHPRLARLLIAARQCGQTRDRRD